jgi:surfactin synthase thioesterase subunit
MTVPGAAPDSPWIRRYASAPSARTQLVCLPHAGGSAAFFMGVAKALSPDIDTLAIQYPGRLDRWREPLIENMTELADLLVAELAPWTDRGIAVFGHSLGALLGFEIARRLEAMGHAPVALFVSGRGAPSRHQREFSHRPDDQTLVHHIRKLGGTDPRVFNHDEALRLALPVIRADYEAVDSYCYERGLPLSCPVTVLNGADDPRVSPADAEAWREQTSAAFESLSFPGGHFYLVDQYAQVTDAIASRLSRLTAAHRNVLDGPLTTFLCNVRNLRNAWRPA